VAENSRAFTSVTENIQPMQTTALNSRETIRQALAHQPGRVPIDFSSTPVTGIHVSIVAALREHYGLSGGPLRVMEPGQMLGEVADDLRGAMGVDCVGFIPPRTSYGFPLDAPWREWRCPWGQIVLVPEGFRTRTDDEGNVFLFPCGDTSAPASGEMPATGYFFDTIVRQEPIDEDHLNPEDNLEEFAALSDADLELWRARAVAMRESERGVIANIGGPSFGDIARVMAPQLRHPRGIRDVAEWYMSLVARQDYIHAIFSRQCEITLENLARFHAVVGESIDVLYLCSTDFGTQASQFCSVATFDELFVPYYQRLNDWVHRHTTWKTFKHSCGAIDPLLPSLIRAGFDIMNPVQCSAAHMEPEHLKETYGRDLVFWGGGVDTQRTLPFGTADEVYDQVMGRCRIFSRDGGFVFNTIHNIQARTPVANVVAMLKAVHDFNGAGG
jgi:hypothetical protein